MELPPTLSPQLDNPVPKKKKPNKDLNLTQLPNSSSSSSLPRHKRSNCPGIRVRGGRIFDSENGKTCHQCRQKTMDLIAVCKARRDDKPCTIKFCQKCLLNRYGEKAEETNLLEDWKCPKCRGLCNCSFCMKKKGHRPTGILVHTAKATGFVSVLEMLNVKGPENVRVYRSKEVREGKRKVLENITTDYNAREWEDGCTQLKKRKKKKAILNTGIDLNVMASEEMDEMADGGENMLVARQNKLKKLARARKCDNVEKSGSKYKKRVKKACLSNGIYLDDTLNEDDNTSELADGENIYKIAQNKLKNLAWLKSYINSCENKARSVNDTEGPCNFIIASSNLPRTQERKADRDSEFCILEETSTKFIREEEESDQMYMSLPARGKKGGNDNFYDKPNPITSHNLKVEPVAAISLPQAINLRTVADIELPAEDVLQFLEFCNAFGEELLSKKVPDEQVPEPSPCVPLEILASWCNLVHMIS